MQPKVSVIITTWNRAALAKQAIASVLAQTYEGFELLVLDNSSLDDTEAVVKKFGDLRIRYIQHPQMGISEARNLGVGESRADIFGFLDDDDTWLPKKLKEQMALFERSPGDVGMVYGGFHRIRSTGELYETFVPTLRGDALVGYLCGRNPLTGSASNPLIRKSAWEAVGGYDENLKTSEDWEFYLRLMREFKVEFVTEPLLNVRQHAGARLGDRLRDAAEAELRVVHEFKDVLDAYPRCLSSYLQTIGGKFCRVGDFGTGRTYLQRAIKIAPANIAAYAQLLFSLFGSTGFYRAMHAAYKKLR